ncbi:ATP-binding protein [Robiginitalea sp. M366]|uniref:sensor histidine kinase n=1 Tax=Robiginitalea aestuariiviva TaxID=3036903 RepID=UPI00240E4600|nr:ATP-binding protein [Robiginitalea aestuariiviva]MDG1571542.1 ATP-binding protein [Robiginitalea aestuariiviva]
MDISKTISDILLLYELSMAIGKSVDYDENCSSFLKLFLARKGLTAAWILRRDEAGYECTYAMPLASCRTTPGNGYLAGLPEDFDAKILPANSAKLQWVTPVPYTDGSVTIFNLRNQGLLFVHSIREAPFTELELNQLRPIILKFSYSLEGSSIVANQQQLLKRLESQNRQLNDYAHVVSHDLKSPLHNINTLAGWVQDDHADTLSAEALKKLDLIRENTERMEKLISGLLNYSSVKEGSVEREEVDLYQTVKSVIGILPITKTTRVRVEPLPMVYGDPLHFQQLFQNLIDNAVKSLDKPKGQVEVGCDFQQTPAVFHIRDNGKGIDRKYHERIFQIFEKLDTEGTRSGIGLSIVQRIIEHYKGRIWLESQPGEGTTFFFTLGTTATRPR